MKRSILFLFMGMFVSSQLVLANGWECDGKKSTYEVRLYDRVSDNATKSPAVLLVTRNGELVALAKGKAIKMETEKSDFTGPKTPSGEMKVYTVKGKDLEAVGDSPKDIKEIVLQVNANQDSPQEKLEYRQERAGRILIDSKGDTEQTLSCQYYLKGARQAAKKAE